MASAETLGGRRAAALGAVLVALNPFLVWYSQEARMFMPATTFVLVGLYGTTATGRCERPKVDRPAAGSCSIWRLF